MFDISKINYQEDIAKDSGTGDAGFDDAAKYLNLSEYLSISPSSTKSQNGEVNDPEFEGFGSSSDYLSYIRTGENFSSPGARDIYNTASTILREVWGLELNEHANDLSIFTAAASIFCVFRCQQAA